MKTKLFTLFLAIIVGTGTMSAEIQNPAPLYGIWYDFFTSATGFEAFVTYMDGDWEKNSYSGKITIPSYVFYQYIDPVSFTPERVKYIVSGISSYAFYGCPSLESVTLPETIKSIGAYAFYNDTKLQSIILPDSVEYVGEGAFRGCTKLRYIACRSITPPQLNSYNFENVDTLFVRVGRVKAYKNAPNWKNFTTILPMTDNGSCNGKVTWNWNFNTKTLTISGNDTMPNYASNMDVPWADCIPYIEHIDITNDVTSIGDYAFANYPNLMSVKIGINISSIGEYAFFDCDTLDQIYWNVKNFPDDSILRQFGHKLPEFHRITIGDDVERIPSYFCWGKEIKSIRIPDNVRTIGYFAFNECDRLQEVVLGKGLDSIGDYAFSQTNIHVITIPDNIRRIGNHAFAKCSNLKEVVIGQGLETINDFAFYNCDSLEIVSIGHGVKSIGNMAFFGTRIKNIIIPDNVQKLGDAAFGSDSLQFAYIGRGLDSIEGQILYTQYVIDTIYWNAKDVRSLPHQIYSILPNASNIVIGSAVENIPSKLARDNTFLRDIIIPNNVVRVGDWAFIGCDSVRLIYIGENVKEIGSRSFDFNYPSCNKLVLWNATNYPDSASSPFEYYSYDEESMDLFDSIIIGENVYRIPMRLCAGLRGLKHVHIPNGVKIIGDGAFDRCSSLTSLFVPKSVDSIGNYSFNGIPNIEYYGNAEGDKWGAKCRNGIVDGYFVFGDTEKTQLMACSNVALGDIVIPNSVTYMQDFAFEYTNKITSISIPGSLVVIPRGAFNNSKRLQKVLIAEGVQRIEESAFAYCDSLSSISLPNSLQNIAPYAFDNTKLEIAPENWENGIMYLNHWLINVKEDLSGDIIVRNNTQGIAEDAFRGTNITSIMLPQSIRWIGNHAFRGCSSLKSINLPGGISRIGKYTFSYCSNLSSINIPRDVKEIGEEAFYGCENLRAVYLDDIKAWCDIDFGYNGNPLLNTGNLYLNDTLITNLIIPEGVKQLRWQTFMNDTNLISVVIPSSLDTIDGNTFEGCKNIKRVIWNAENCRGQHYDQYYNHPGPFNAARDSIVEFVFGEKVTRIPANLCKEMTNLDTIRLPKSVEVIEETAFKECYLSAVICEAETPPTLIMDDYYQESPFAYSQNDLYVPATSIKAYRESAIWKDFYNIYPIGLVPAHVESVKVEVLEDSNSIIISWQVIDNAHHYEINIMENEETIYSLTFDTEGHLIDYKNNSKRKLIHNTSAESEINGWKYIINDLKQNTYYTYSITAFSSSDNILAENTGSFTMPMSTDIYKENLTIEMPTIKKISRNGQIFILLGDKTYTITGAKVK